MSESVNVCGTGGWAGPKPGDPDNNSILSATTSVGGIKVSWSYPTTNPYAVAHVLLYRGTVNSFEMASQIAVVSGSVYQDQLNPVSNTLYYYWIQVVSVNGTVGTTIGPASAIARPLGEQTLESLTGRIDSGVLATALRTEIANIIVVGQSLVQEIQDRIAGNTALAAAIASVQSGAESAMTFVQAEIIQRITSDEALVQSVNTLAAAMDQNVAAIFQEQLLRVTADSALATDVTQLYTTTGDNTSAISQEATSRTTADAAIASNVVLLFAQSATNAAAIQSEATVRATADTALGSQITTVQASLNNDIASVQVTLQSNINTVDGKVFSIGALYTAKVSVNGLIGGFGVYNNGTEVQAGFDVDTFWVGRTNSDKVKPFIIDGGVVYIDKARIRTADIDTLKIAGNAVTVPSVDFRSGTVTGNGTNTLVANLSVTLDQPGWVYAIFTANQTYGTGLRISHTTMNLAGQQVVVGGEAVTTNIAVSLSRYLPAGSHSVQVYWSGQDSNVRVDSTNLFVMGVKR